MTNLETSSRALGAWLLFGILGSAATVFLHEIGHYIPAVLLNATNIELLPTSVHFDPESVTDMGHVITAGGGLVATLLLTIWAFWGVRQTHHPFFYVLGITSQLRGGLVAIVYFYFLLTTGENPFTVVGGSGNDEATIAHYADISILPVILFSVAMLLIWEPYFWRSLYKNAGGWRAVRYCIVGFLVGAFVYGFLTVAITGNFSF